MYLSVRAVAAFSILVCVSVLLIAMTQIFFQSKEGTEEMPVEGVLILEGKGEVVGNLVSAKLTDSGVEFFSCGEFFEAKPLIKITDPEVSVRQQIWADGVSYRRILAGSVELEDRLAAYGDKLTYILYNPSKSKVKLRLYGGLQVFSWFNPGYRRTIAERADVRFQFSDGYLKGFYGEVYCVYLASSRGWTIEVEPDQATYEVRLELEPGDTFVFTLVGASSEVEARRGMEEVLANYLKVEEGRKKEVASILEKIPRLTEVQPEYERLWKYMWYVILSNRVLLQGHPVLRKPFNMPSKFVFRHQWLWDSAFHAIVLTEYDVSMAEEELLNLFAAQKPDGRIPHEIFISKEFCSLFWEVEDYAPWTTQPPVLAIAVERIMEKGGSQGFLIKALEALDRYDRWFRSHRDADGDHLIAYVDYLESGWDNAVRWDEALALFQSNPEKYRELYSQIRMAPVEAVDLNCFIYIQRTVLSKLADQLGLHAESEEYRRLAAETAKGIRRDMWDSETQFYYDILEEDKRLIKVKSPAAFATMYAKLATQEQTEELLEHLLNAEEFWTRFPLPTVSVDHSAYDPRGYWRGRSWVNQIWLTYHGLKEYGFKDEAKRLAQKVLDIMVSGPTCNENYDSSTGEPLGAPDFGWSTLALEFLVDLSSAT